jgi:hypothetical protein
MVSWRGKSQLMQTTMQEWEDRKKAEGSCLNRECFIKIQNKKGSYNYGSFVI